MSTREKQLSYVPWRKKSKWHVRKTINKRATEEKWQMARKSNHFPTCRREKNGKWHVKATIFQRATEEKWQMAHKSNHFPTCHRRKMVNGTYFHFSSYLPERKPCSMINAGLAVVYNRKFIIYRRKICITQ